MNAREVPRGDEADTGLAELSPQDLEAEYRALLQFLHLAPIGLVRARRNGDISLINPMAAQLLNPIGFGTGETLNLLDIFDRVTPDIRVLVQTFDDSSGVIFDNYRVTLPDQPAGVEAPVALGVTMLRVQAELDCLMVVITDESAAVKLQRLQASWMR